MTSPISPTTPPLLTPTPFFLTHLTPRQYITLAGGGGFLRYLSACRLGSVHDPTKRPTGYDDDGNHPSVLLSHDNSLVDILPPHTHCPLIPKKRGNPPPLTRFTSQGTHHRPATPSHEQQQQNPWIGPSKDSPIHPISPPPRFHLALSSPSRPLCIVYMYPQTTHWADDMNPSVNNNAICSMPPTPYQPLVLLPATDTSSRLGPSTTQMPMPMDRK